MARNKRDNFSTTYRKEIVWLQWYFLRDKKYPKMTVLERKIFDCKIADDQRGLKRLLAIKIITEMMINKTEKRMIKAIKEIYVYRTITVIGAAQTILFLSQTQAYVHLKDWFNEYGNCVFDLIQI